MKEYPQNCFECLFAEIRVNKYSNLEEEWCVLAEKFIGMSRSERNSDCPLIKFDTINNPIWHNYLEWEDYINGMYNTRNDNVIVEQCKKLFKDKNLYNFMTETVKTWTKSADVNLSKTIFNRKAWVGQATCSYIKNATIQETTSAWVLLTEPQRKKANLLAQIVIEEWEDENIQRTPKCL
jgi:hypothetical protein